MKLLKLHGKGNHLILDGYSKYKKLSEVRFIENFLVELTKEIKMRAISKPLVLYHNCKTSEESGVTGTILLAESNITIHTYPNKNQFYLDIFSCNEFEIGKTLDYLRENLKITKYKKRLLRRSLKWKK